MDKTTLGSSAILGIEAATKLTTNECVSLTLLINIAHVYLGITGMHEKVGEILDLRPTQAWHHLLLELSRI